MNTLWNRKIVLVITACFCGLLWGSAHTCIKSGYRLFSIAADDPAGQILFAGTRFFIAGILVILFACISRKTILIPGRSDLRPVAVLALFQTILQYVLFYFGLAYASAARTSIISGTTSFVSIIIAVLIFRFEKLTWRKLMGCILGFAGVVIMETAGQNIDAGVSLKGEVLVILSVISSSLAANYIKLFGRNHDPVLLSGYQFMAGGLIMMIFSYASGGRLVSDSVYAWLLILYMAFISSAAYTLWGILLKYHPVSSVTVFSFITPVAGVFISAIVLREHQAITLFTIAALILVSAGIIIVSAEPAGK